MSGDPSVRARLLEAATGLLSEEGPAALTTRRVGAAAGMSSMVVYTQFGSIGSLIEALVSDGFDRLAASNNDYRPTSDPVADLTELAHANVDFARASPNLYQVMFGSIALGSYRSTQMQQATEGRTSTFDFVTDACGRAVAAERFLPGDAFLLANQWWTCVHGFILLEIAGYLQPPASTHKVLGPTLTSLFVGLGDERKAASRSVEAHIRTAGSTAR